MVGNRRVNQKSTSNTLPSLWAEAMVSEAAAVVEAGAEAMVSEAAAVAEAAATLPDSGAEAMVSEAAEVAEAGGEAMVAEGAGCWVMAAEVCAETQTLPETRDEASVSTALTETPDTEAAAVTAERRAAADVVDGNTQVEGNGGSSSQSLVSSCPPLVCERCKQPIVDDKFQIQGRSGSNIKCNKCCSKYVQLTTAFKQWPPAEFADFDADELSEFWRGTHTLTALSNLCHYVKVQFVKRRLKRQKLSKSGQYLPLSV